MSPGWDEVIAAWRRRVEQLDALAMGSPRAEGDAHEGEALPETPAVACSAAQRNALAELLASSRGTERRLREQHAAIGRELGELAARRRAARGYAQDGQAHAE